jgi:hypothetical protein
MVLTEAEASFVRFAGVGFNAALTALPKKLAVFPVEYTRPDTTI